MTNKVYEEQIDITDEMVCLYEGKPFTGVVVDEDNGRVIGETHYKDGLQDGVSRAWFMNGQLQSETRFVENSRHGLDKKWYENGAKKSEIRYEHGVVARQIDWDLNGNVTKDYELKEGDPGYELLELRRGSRS